MNNEEFLKDIEFLDPESQRLLRSLQHSVIPIQKLQGQGYGNFQDMMVDKIELGENIRGMNNVSPLATFKFFNQTSDNITSKYFIDAEPPLEGTFSYISDVGSNLDNEIKTTVKDFYYYNVKDVRNFAFKVVIFSSTEATKLKECFDVAKPLGREILIFIEDNSTDSVSGTYGAIRISQEVLDFLKPGNRLAYDVKDNQNIYTELKAAVPALTDDQIKSLLHNGYIEDTRIEAVTTWLKIASFFSSTVSMMYPSLGILTNDLVRKSTSDLLGKIIKKIEEAKFKENQWQPKAPKNEKGETDKNYQYQPLISVDEKDNANINIAQFTKVLQKMLDEQRAYVKTELKISKNFSGNSEPNSILEFLYQKYFKAYTIAKSVISQIQGLSDLEILKYGAKTYNALLCGVWNGLVDAVAGLFAMVKLLYDGITLGKDFVKNIDKYLPTLLEQFDEAIQAIEKLNFTEIAKYVFGKLKGNGLTFDPIACAYFVGYAFGFIISLIIEIVITVVLTGSSLTIPLIVEKLSEALFGIFRLAWAGTIKIARTFGNFVVKSIDDVLKGFQELLNYFKKGWDEIKKSIDDGFETVIKTIDEQVNIFTRKLPSNMGKFVDLLTKNFPNLQKKIVDGLLVIEFKGNIIARINPKGIIVEIKYFRELDGNYTYFTELKNVKIELEVIDDFGRTSIKKYEDTVEVMKKVDDVGFRAKFEEGKVRDGEYINYTYGKSGKDPAYATNPLSKSKTVDVALQEGDIFHIVEYKDRGLQRDVPGNFGSKDKINTIRELREDIAVKKDWKDEARGEIVIRTYKVKAGKEIPSRSGWVGPMLEDTPSSPYFNEILPGGSHQYEFINAWDSDFVYLIDKIDEKILK